ncbi:hypothetical protein PR048_018838 [Dryococelus australis]|uniref:Uncharacterized protein n=1 Tax=Dryococelus australis TaxID=614101 RepID=A0ABQ9H1W4_9NEOP|nr:hypothetical protein PR048_018838 [Dryococelus australis]
MVAKRLARSPPTKAGSPDFRKWEYRRTMPLVGGFSRGSPVSPAPSFLRRSIFTSIALIGSQDLAVQSRQIYSLTFKPRSEGAIRATLTRTPSASSLLRARRDAVLCNSTQICYCSKCESRRAGTDTAPSSRTSYDGSAAWRGVVTRLAEPRKEFLHISISYSREAVPEHKKNLKASERVTVDVFTQNKQPCPQTTFLDTPSGEGNVQSVETCKIRVIVLATVEEHRAGITCGVVRTPCWDHVQCCQKTNVFTHTSVSTLRQWRNTVLGSRAVLSEDECLHTYISQYFAPMEEHRAGITCGVVRIPCWDHVQCCQKTNVFTHTSVSTLRQWRNTVLGSRAVLSEDECLHTYISQYFAPMEEHRAGITCGVVRTPCWDHVQCCQKTNVFTHTSVSTLRQWRNTVLGSRAVLSEDECLHTYISQYFAPMEEHRAGITCSVVRRGMSSHIHQSVLCANGGTPCWDHVQCCQKRNVFTHTSVSTLRQWRNTVLGSRAVLSEDECLHTYISQYFAPMEEHRAGITCSVVRRGMSSHRHQSVLCANGGTPCWDHVQCCQKRNVFTHTSVSTLLQWRNTMLGSRAVLSEDECLHTYISQYFAPMEEHRAGITCSVVRRRMSSHIHQSVLCANGGTPCWDHVQCCQKRNVFTHTSVSTLRQWRNTVLGSRAVLSEEECLHTYISQYFAPMEEHRAGITCGVVRTPCWDHVQCCQKTNVFTHTSVSTLRQWRNTVLGSRAVLSEDECLHTYISQYFAPMEEHRAGITCSVVRTPCWDHVQCCQKTNVFTHTSVSTLRQWRNTVLGSRAVLSEEECLHTYIMLSEEECLHTYISQYFAPMEEHRAGITCSVVRRGMSSHIHQSVLCANGGTPCWDHVRCCQKTNVFTHTSVSTLRQWRNTVLGSRAVLSEEECLHRHQSPARTHYLITHQGADVECVVNDENVGNTEHTEADFVRHNCGDKARLRFALHTRAEEVEKHGEHILSTLKADITPHLQPYLVLLQGLVHEPVYQPLYEPPCHDSSSRLRFALHTRAEEVEKHGEHILSTLKADITPHLQPYLVLLQGLVHEPVYQPLYEPPCHDSSSRLRFALHTRAEEVEKHGEHILSTLKADTTPHLQPYLVLLQGLVHEPVYQPLYEPPCHDSSSRLRFALHTRAEEVEKHGEHILSTLKADTTPHLQPYLVLLQGLVHEPVYQPLYEPPCHDSSSRLRFALHTRAEEVEKHGEHILSTLKADTTPHLQPYLVLLQGLVHEPVYQPLYEPPCHDSSSRLRFALHTRAEEVEKHGEHILSTLKADITPHLQPYLVLLQGLVHEPVYQPLYEPPCHDSSSRLRFALHTRAEEVEKHGEHILSTLKADTTPHLQPYLVLLQGLVHEPVYQPLYEPPCHDSSSRLRFALHTRAEEVEKHGEHILSTLKADITPHLQPYLVLLQGLVHEPVYQPLYEPPCHDSSSRAVKGPMYLRVQGEEARERYGRHLHACLAPHRSYEQGVQCFRRNALLKSHTQKDPAPKEISDIDSRVIICWKTFPVHEGKADNTALISVFGNASMFSRKKVKFELGDQIGLYRKLVGTTGDMHIHGRRATCTCHIRNPTQIELGQSHVMISLIIPLTKCEPADYTGTKYIRWKDSDKDYEHVQQTLEEIVNGNASHKSKSALQVYIKRLQKMETMFFITAAICVQQVMRLLIYLLVQILLKLRSETGFSKIYQETEELSKKLNLKEPVEKRIVTVPRKLENSLTPSPSYHISLVHVPRICNVLKFSERPHAQYASLVWFHALSFIHTKNTSSAIVPHKTLRPHSARWPSPKTAGRWAAAVFIVSYVI